MNIYRLDFYCTKKQQVSTAQIPNFPDPVELIFEAVLRQGCLMPAAEEGSREAELPGERSRERSGPACLWRFPAGAGGRRCSPAAAAAGRSRRKGGHAGAAGAQDEADRAGGRHQ